MTARERRSSREAPLPGGSRRPGERGSRPRASDSLGLNLGLGAALGSGLGVTLGAIFGAPALGAVFGASFGLILAPILVSTGLFSPTKGDAP